MSLATGKETEADIGFGDCVNRQLFGVITKNDFEEPQFLEVEELPTNQKFESSNQKETSMNARGNVASADSIFMVRCCFWSGLC